MVDPAENEDLQSSKIRNPRAFDYATVTVIALGVALWLSWPRGTTEAQARIPSHTFISYSDVSSSVLSLTREPLLFVEYVRTTTPALKEDVTEMYADFVASRASAPVDLPQTYGPSSMFDLNSALQAPEQKLVTPYRPRWEDRAVFDLTNMVIAPISIKLSIALEHARLQLPQWNSSFERFSESSWKAVFELSGNGREQPRDVFVVESSGNTELDQWFVRKLYASRARHGSGPWRGQVSISARNE